MDKKDSIRIPECLVRIAHRHKGIFPIGVCMICLQAGFVDLSRLGYPAGARIPPSDPGALKHAAECVMNRLLNNNGKLKAASAK